ncbi:hypothetical protein F2P79_008469 [Pimephales promelas]|nr:hypothetical protein F2P79_008469 [Pimephales promelas]
MKLQTRVHLLASKVIDYRRITSFMEKNVTYNMPGLVWCTSSDKKPKNLQRLQNEKQTLRESNAPADDSGSLQEQVKQVGIMLKMFAHTGQSGADVLESLGDVVRSMDNKMDYAASF